MSQSRSRRQPRPATTSIRTRPTHRRRRPPPDRRPPPRRRPSPPRRRPKQEKQSRIAQRFVEARDAWDGEAVRALVTDDAVIDDLAISTADDYLPGAEIEQATGWRYMQPECTTIVPGPPIQVSCTYTMQNAWSEALGVGPFTGSNFRFVIADGQIQQVTHRFDFSEFDPQVYAVFQRVADRHPPQRHRRHVRLQQRQLQPHTRIDRPLRTPHHRVRRITQRRRIRLSKRRGHATTRGQEICSNTSHAAPPSRPAATSTMNRRDAQRRSARRVARVPGVKATGSAPPPKASSRRGRSNVATNMSLGRPTRARLPLLLLPLRRGDAPVSRNALSENARPETAGCSR